MHFCTAHIAIGGDNQNVMVRGEFHPVSWPEIEILRLLHGDDAVTEVVPFVRVNQTGRDERERLALIYGEGICAQLWGGKNPPRELEAPDVKLPKDVNWHNPLTGAAETSPPADRGPEPQVPADEPDEPAAKSAKKK